MCKGHGTYNVTQSFYPDVIVSKIDFSGANFKSDYLENKALHSPPPHPPIPPILNEIQCRLYRLHDGEQKKGDFHFLEKLLYIVKDIYCHQCHINVMSK